MKNRNIETRELRGNTPEVLVQAEKITEILSSIDENHIRTATGCMGFRKWPVGWDVPDLPVRESDIRLAAEHLEAAAQALRSLKRAVYHPIKRLGSQEKQLEIISQNILVDAININDTSETRPDPE